MNRKACIISILFFIYQLFNSLQNKSGVFIIYNIIGILMLILCLVWDLIQNQKDLTNITREVPYINFAFLYFILGVQIDNLITYINSEYYLGIILYIEGT